jgi:class 3 adenylate cyclase
VLGSKLKGWLGWPQPPELLGLMHPVKPWPLQMERYSRGIDNTHIDVSLSPRFAAQAGNLVRTMVHYDVTVHCWGSLEKQPSPRDLQGFRTSYRELQEGAMRQRQRLSTADWTRLAQLALLKLLLQLVPAKLQELRRSLESSRDAERALASGRRLEYHDRLVILAREEWAVAYRVYQRLFRLVTRLESGPLRRLRKSLLGVSWPVPREALFNALLQLPGLLAGEEMMHHYPILGMGESGIIYLDALNRCIVEVFRDYLPTWTQPGQRGVGEGASQQGGGRALHIIDRLDQGGLRGFLETEIVLSQLLAAEEYKKPQYSWLDDPDNLALLLASDGDLGEELEGAAPHWYRAGKHWRHFKHAVQEELVERLERTDITQRILASYWVPRLCQDLAGVVPARLIYEYLINRQGRRQLLRRLAADKQGLDITAVSRALDLAVGEIRQQSRASRRAYLMRILVDFLALRRDLKLAYKTFEAMDQIRICTDHDDISLSRANGLLYEFRMQDEQQEEQQRICCHTILKADVRGSTRITAELRAGRLNPATHFSQNFFNPINELLSDYGATKVFVEGDAVILSFLETSGDAQSSLSVARACGLAGRILEVVARQNVLNRRYGLPDLELGLGIAFADEEPTFLYDGDRPIMISPAINQADRLSSCAKVLRAAAFAQRGRPFRVEVLIPAEGSDATAGAKTDVLRYNVNGVELDEASFEKLKTELVLHRLDFPVSGKAERFHVGRYPDRRGRIQWLVVREAPVRVWDGGQISNRQAPGRRFYEVVVDATLLTLIRAKLRPSREDRSDDVDTAPRFPGPADRA